MIAIFREFLERFFPKERIKYNRDHLFVNSRPLLREFFCAKKNLYGFKNVFKSKKVIRAYIAGRFDGDGSISKNLRNDCRIIYGKKYEAEKDKMFLRKIDISNTKIYRYRIANTFCLYVSRYEAKKFIKTILSHSLKLQKLASVPRRDLTLNEAK